MTVIALPNDPIPFTSARLELVRADQTLEFLTGARQVTAFSKALWRASWTLPALRGASLAPWRAALIQLSTPANTFTQRPPGYTGPATGYAGPAPLVAGASQLGKSLAADGVTASAAIAAAGDYISVIAAGKRELKMLTAAATATGLGAVTFAFEPALRNAPADNAVIELFTPLAEFALDEPLFGVDLDATLNGRMAIAATEMFAP